MEQLAFPFMGQRYDVGTDSMVPVDQNYVDQLANVSWAYGQIRKACSFASHEGVETVPLIVLNTIHDALKSRLNVPA